MKNKRNEEIFNDELVVLDYLIYEYKKELKKTVKSEWNQKEFKATRKARLNRLRKEINELLYNVENNLGYQYCCEV